MRIVKKAPDDRDSRAESMTLSNGLIATPELSGLQLNLPYSVYNEDAALRISVLDRISVSPLYLKASLDEEDDNSLHLILGRVFHILILQPEQLEATTIVVNATTRNTNIYKGIAAQNPEKTVLLKRDYDDLCRMRDRFQTKTLNRSLLNNATCEASCFWTDPIAQIRCKARLDVLATDYVIDIKTTRAIRYFRQDADIFGYIRQAAWYLDAVRAVTGKRIDRFLFIAVERKAPFDSQIFELGQKTLAKARAQNDANLAIYRTCLQSNEWPGYPERIEELAP